MWQSFVGSLLGAILGIPLGGAILAAASGGIKAWKKRRT